MPESLLAEFYVFFTIVLIDIALAGDNAVVVGQLASGLPDVQKRRAILLGVVLALIFRVAFALVAVQLLQIVGLLLAGGLLLLWVSYKMYRELREGHHADQVDPGDVPVARKTFAAASFQIAVADVSMSLDNVLAVAGVAKDHLPALIFGLILSIALMGVAANFIARWMERHRWLAWVGLLIILFVALKMTWEGGHEVLAAL
ncbi:MAG TPA: YjbE family putative metal transport protein [Geminicoccus sp.]|uniref:YjbE family putative metal transport protein n=1 Tax=Geminicoccus sp. TaxID=2024832 RepID=UPI002B656893|nr:YjbE family putative metal transport protein [Geminicoccus sp.]HWL71718.1 YjbE family putative metal transport protein [Geminicoccus sp.]